MDFNELKQILQKYYDAANKIFALPAENDLNSESIEKLISEYLPIDSTTQQHTLKIENAKQVISSDQVSYDGTAFIYTNQSSALDIEAVFWIINEAPVLRVSTRSLPGDWTLGTGFPSLKETVLNSFGFSNPTLILASIDSTATGSSSIYKFGLNFNGTPTATGPLKPVQWLLPDLDQLILAGVITFSKDKAIISLGAESKESITIKPVTLKVAVRLYSEWIPPNTTDYFNTGAVLTADVEIGPESDPVTIPIKMDLFSDKPALLTFMLADKPQPIPDFSELNTLAGGGDFNKHVPSQLPISDILNITGLELVISPQLHTTVSSVFVEVSLNPETPWTIIPKALAIAGLKVSFTVLFGSSAASSIEGTAPAITSTILGRFVIGDTFEYDVSITVPDLVLSGSLAPYSTIKVGKLLEHFLSPVLGKIEGIPDLEVYQLDMVADYRNKTYSLSAGISDLWEIKLPLFKMSIQQVTANINYDTNAITYDFAAYWVIDNVTFITRAEKPAGDNGWNFSIATMPGDGIDLITIAKKFLQTDIQFPPSVPTTLQITDVLIAMNTKTRDYSLRATTLAEWDLVLGDGYKFSVKASIDIQSSSDPTTFDRPYALITPATEVDKARSFSGTISGEIPIWEFSFTVEYAFSPGNETLTFKFNFKGISLNCTLTTIKNPQTGNPEKILKVNLGGISFGGILEFLVNLVNPNLGFRLSSPWDVLNEINFDNLALEINLAHETVGFTYNLNKNLGIIDIETIGLAYVNKAGRKTVDISITGNFLGAVYKPENPLQWDLLNDPPPSPPGKGEKLLDLRYLGLGQNVTFRETKNFTNVQSVIEALEKDFAPVDDEQQNPLQGLAELKFSGDGQWLIGAHFIIMNTISLMGVFNDPTLYGLRVALAGERAKALAGLQFEILYKKVTETIGVYHLELKLPDAMRQIQLGSASLTLPIIDIDIYTNGNFRIDMGFPVGGDFSRSFCLQWLPFIGYGGFYFAVLNGETSDTVPKITNGEFSPVIEFGLGVSVGVGKTIDKGILSAGVSLTVDGIIEGTLAWFNPSDGSSSKDMYYRIQGTAAIVGKLYGTVNFVIIQADVSVVAYASATLLAIAYEPIEITLVLGVEVSVSIKIVFVRVHFSFKTKLDLSFSIGSKGDPDPPWRAVGSNPSANPLLLRQQRTKYRKKPLTGPDLLRMMLRATGEKSSFNWTPHSVFNGEIVPLSLVLMPALTVAIPETLYLNAGKPSGSLNGTPGVQAVMSLFIDNSIDSNARRADEVLKVTRENPETASFNRLVEGILLWMLNALVKDNNSPVFGPFTGDTVEVIQLEALQEYLNKSANRETVFQYDNIVSFIQQNFRLNIGTPIGVTGSALTTAFANVSGAAGPEVSATIFPMIPDMKMSPEKADAIEFWNHSCVSKKYIKDLEEYFNQLQLNVEENVPRRNSGNGSDSRGADRAVTPGPVGTASGPVGCTGDNISMATVIFQDYFAMLAKASVDSALDMLKAYPYMPTDDDSLVSIAGKFGKMKIVYTVQPGDTIASICGTFGISPHEIRSNNTGLGQTSHTAKLNAGDKLLLTAGVTPTSIAVANADYPLHYLQYNPVRMTIEGVKHQVRSGDTLAKIISDFGISDLGTLFTFIPANMNQNPNATNIQLLQAKAKMEIPGFTYTVQDPEEYQRTLLRIASLFWVRNREGVDDAEYIGWYKQQIAAADHTAGKPIKVPVAEKAPGGGITSKGTTGYYVKEGDTVDLIAGYFQTIQLNFEDASFQEFIRGISGPHQGLTGPVPRGATLSIPPQQHNIQAGDKFENVANLFKAGVETDVNITSIAQANQNTENLLQPRAVVALPTLNYPIGQHDTLASVAAKLDLTVEELAQSVEGCTGIFTPGMTGAAGASGPGIHMTIPDVPSADVNQLLKDLVDNGKFNNISAMVSRFLMHGLRVLPPDGNGTGSQAAGPISPGNNPGLWGLYEIVGQQFPAPSMTATKYDTIFTKGASADWICFQGPSGATGCADDLTVRMDPGFLNDAYPGLTFKPQILTGLTALPLYQESATKYAFQQDIHWQTVTGISLPGPTGSDAAGPTGTVKGNAGQPSIWLFPDTLTQNIASQTGLGPTAGTPPYDLYAPASNKTAASKPRKLQSYSWATAVPLRVRRIPAEAAGTWLPNSYVIVGADETGRDTLLKAWKYLENSYPLPGDRIYLLYRPGATSNNSSGLVSDKLDPTGTFLLKTNLSTVTTSNIKGFDQLDEMPGISQTGDYYARIKAPADFLKYVWEASITGRGGFYLNYVNAGGGRGLPAELFANDTEAIVWMILLLDNQTRASQPVRRIYPFNNCAVLAENLDASSLHIYATLENPTPGDLHRVSTVPAGSVGFHLARENPDPGLSGPVGPTYREAITQSLYNLVGYQILEGDFIASPEGLPIGPAMNDHDDGEGFPRPFYANSDPGIWSYSHVLPAYRFGKVNDIPSCTALPSVDHNPYRGLTGITGPTGASRPLSTTKLQLAFHDVYGNKTVSAEPMVPIDVPYGYTDEIIAVNAWPGTAFEYSFVKGATAGVSLDSMLAFQVAPYIPGGGVSFDQAVEAAASHSERYKQVFYQVQQKDLKFQLGTNLGVVKQEAETLKAPMLSFVSKAKVFVDTAGQLHQKKVKAGTGETFGSIASQYSVTAGALARENQDKLLSNLFAGDIVKPKILTAFPGNSLKNMAAGETPTGPYPPKCSGQTPGQPRGKPGTSPPSVRGLSILASFGAVESAKFLTPPAPKGKIGDPLTPEQLAENNKTVPLSPGTTLRTQTRNYQLPGTFKPGQNNLAAVAASLHCNVYTTVKDPENPTGNEIPIGFFAANYDTGNMIAPGIIIEIQGVKVSTDDAKTFKAIVEAFAAKGLKLTEGEIALAIETIEGIFLPEAKVSCADFIVPRPPPSPSGGPGLPGISLENLPEGSGTIDEVATLNRIVENFFAQGVPVYINYTCSPPDEYYSFTSLAKMLKTTVELLAQFNEPTTLKQGAELLIPNLTLLPGDAAATCFASYTPKPDDSLESIETLMGTGVAALAEINRYLPGIFQDGVPIIIDTKTVNAKPLDSLQTVFEEFHNDIPALDFDGFITAVQAKEGLYNTRGVMITRLAKIPDNGSGQSASWGDIAKSFNIQPAEADNAAPAAALLQANASLEGFLRKGAEIQYPSREHPVPVGPYDTVDTIIGRFKTKYDLTVTSDDLAQANLASPNLLTVGSAFLLPPNPTRFRSQVEPKIPPPGSSGESSFIFPANVYIRMTREKGLVNPDFLESTPVYEASSSLAPRGEKQEKGSISLKGFAKKFEEAFAPWKLKSATSKKSLLEKGKGKPGKVFAVNFGPGGMTGFAVQANAPQFYALRPLSTTLQNDTLWYRPYKSGCGLCSNTISKKFEAVDLDSWMRQFLSTVDLVLTSPYAVSAFSQGVTGAAGLSMEQPAASPLAAPVTIEQLTGPKGFAGTGSPHGVAFEPAEYLEGAEGCTGCTGATAPFGPVDFDAIVTAKNNIAADLKKDVVTILENTGATGYFLETAKETLYQQMLVSLSSGYDVNSVIQYPVEVNSSFITPYPGTTGPNPPRFSGKIVPRLYFPPVKPEHGTETGNQAENSPENSLESAAKNYGVSTPYLASTLINVRGILSAKAAVTYQSQSYSIKTNDTLFDVAKFFKILNKPGDLSDGATWMTWTGFIDGTTGTTAGIGNQGILNEGASFPLVKIERQVNRGDSLLLLSEFVGIDVESFARANQSFKGILLKGTEITIDSQSYTVLENDTLLSIVGAININKLISDKLTIDGLAVYLRDKTTVLDSSKTLSCVQLLPDVTLSTAKVSLGHVAGTGQNPALSFLFTVKHPGRYQHLFLNLDYVINEVEYAINNVPGVTGYQESSWLSFILPMGEGDGSNINVKSAMPQVQVPLPLRSYPTPPVLAGQSALASKPDANNIPDARLWDYRFDFESRNAAQDSNHVEVTFNHQDPRDTFSMFRTQQIFEALAEFIEAYPLLRKDLALLPTLAPGTQNQTAALAVQALSLMAANIARAVNSTGNNARFGEQWPQQTYGYKLQNFSYSTHYKELLLGIEKSPTGPNYWPDIYVQSPTAPTAGTGPDAGFLQLGFVGATGQTGFYLYPDGIPKNKKLTQRFRFKERDVIKNKNAWGGVFLSRNEDLIASGPLGLTGQYGAYETNPDFVYSTPLVRFIDRQTPLINNQQVFDIASLTGPSGPPAPQPWSLQDHLTNMLDAVLELGPSSPFRAESYLEVLCRYAYVVSNSTPGGGTGASEQLLAKTPVRLVPTFLIDGSNKPRFINQLAQSLKNWKSSAGPTGNNGYLIFETSVFDKAQSSSTGSTEGVETLKPIFRLKELQLPMDKIKWGATKFDSDASPQGPEGYKEWKP